MKIRYNQNGSSILIILVVSILLGVTAMSTISTTSFSRKKIAIRRNTVTAFHIAEAGKEHALAEIRSGRKSPVAEENIVVVEKTSFDNGFYTVLCSANIKLDSVWLESTGTLWEDSTIINVICAPGKTIKYVNPDIQATVYSGSEIILNGNTTIDGNDWDNITQTLEDPMGGVWGLTTKSTFRRIGTAAVGGRGFGPTGNPGAAIIRTNYSGYAPSTPEQALGLDSGDLTEYIQYVNITEPLNFHNEIVYYSPPDIRTNELKLGGSSGILIVHNKDSNAQIKNIHGNFTGIIIADQIVHINSTTTIYGAVFSLSNAPSGSQFSNGTANIRYCAKVISNIRATVPVECDGKMKVVSWFQKK